MKLTLRKVLHNLGALSDLGSEISSTHNFEEVTRTSLHTLLGTLAITRGAIARYSARPRQLKYASYFAPYRQNHREQTAFAGHAGEQNLAAVRPHLTPFWTL